MIPPLFGKQEVEIWRVKKRFPRYGVHIWSLWPNIRFLPSIVTEKNATKNGHIQNVCSMCMKINKVGKQEVGIWWGTYMKLVTKYQISAINSCWEKCNEKCAYMFNVYKNQLNRQTGSSNLTSPKRLPTIWHTYMKLVTKYQISAINSCWEKCDEKCAYMFNVYKNQLSRQTGSRKESDGSKNDTHNMVYIYDACDQISDFCHQQLVRKMRRKISWTDGQM
jgi:hypothetical protein